MGNLQFCFLFSEEKLKGSDSVVDFCFSLIFIAFSESSPTDVELIAVKRQLIQFQLGYGGV